MTDPQTDRPVNDMRELYAVQHAITDSGGTLTPDVHKALDVLREAWDGELQRAQAEAHQYRTALQGTARAAVSVSAAAPPTDTAADVLLWAADQLAACPGAIPYRPQLDEDGGFWWDTRDRDAAADFLRRLAAETAGPETQGARCNDPIECGHEAALGEARETNRRLNLRAQQLESELATYRRAVGQWEVGERGTYISLGSLRAIGKAAGVDILGSRRHLKHFERVEQAEAAIERVRRLHDNLAAETDLTSPDDEITRGAAAKRIATALDGWNPDGLPGCDVEFESGARCAKPAGHRPPGSQDPHVPQRPRCPHCQLPHDLTPGSMPVRACESIRASLAEAKRLHSGGDHSRCAVVDCDVVRERRAAAARQDGAQQ